MVYKKIREKARIIIYLFIYKFDLISTILREWKKGLY